MTLPASAHALSVSLPQATAPTVAVPTKVTTDVTTAVTGTATALDTATPSIPSPTLQSSSALHQSSASAPQPTAQSASATLPAQDVSVPAVPAPQPVPLPKVEAPEVPPLPGVTSVPATPAPAPAPSAPQDIKPAPPQSPAPARSSAQVVSSPEAQRAPETSLPSAHRSSHRGSSIGGAIARAATAGQGVRPGSTLAGAGATGSRGLATREGRSAASGTGFALSAAPAADTVPAGASASPDLRPFAPGLLGTEDPGLLASILLIAGGALLIALMCLDAAGVGPRHEYLRRRVGGWRLPWR